MYHTRTLNAIKSMKWKLEFICASFFLNSEWINSGELICGCTIHFVPFSGDSRGEAVGLY